LDTHAFLWWLDGDRRLSALAKPLLEKNPEDVFVSAATAWEITTKFRIGKLGGAAGVAADVAQAVRNEGFVELPVTMQHAQRSGALPEPNTDPFDRMLIAQAMIENMTLISNEKQFDLYGVSRLW
jgi:PIN domain nuclease of toxin-antitoxin system